MKTGVRGVIRDIFMMYVCFRLILVWLFGAKFDFVLGVMVIILGLSAVWFMVERFGLVN